MPRQTKTYGLTVRLAFSIRRFKRSNSKTLQTFELKVDGFTDDHDVATALMQIFIHTWSADLRRHLRLSVDSCDFVRGAFVRTRSFRLRVGN